MGAHSRPEQPHYDWAASGPTLIPPYPQNYPPPPNTPDQDVATEVVQAVVPTVAPVIGPLIAGAVKEAVARTFAKARKFVAAGAALLLAGSGGAAYVVIQELGHFADRQDEIGNTTRTLQEDVQSGQDAAADGVTSLQRRMEAQLRLLEEATNQRLSGGGQVSNDPAAVVGTGQPGKAPGSPGRAKVPAASVRVPTAAPRAPGATVPTPTPDPVLEAYCQLAQDPIRC